MSSKGSLQKQQPLFFSTSSVLHLCPTAFFWISLLLAWERRCCRSCPWPHCQSHWPPRRPVLTRGVCICWDCQVLSAARLRRRWSSDDSLGTIEIGSTAAKSVWSAMTCNSNSQTSGTAAYILYQGHGKISEIGIKTLQVQWIIWQFWEYSIS